MNPFQKLLADFAVKQSPWLKFIAAVIAAGLPFLVDLNASQTLLDIVIVIHTTVSWLVGIAQRPDSESTQKARSLLAENDKPKIRTLKEIVLSVWPSITKASPALKFIAGILAGLIPFIPEIPISDEFLLLDAVVAFHLIVSSVREWLDNDEADTEG